MKIDYIAHACFKITLKNGTVIVFDPFDKEIGYEFPEVKADYVICSHEHYDHCKTESLIEGYEKIDPLQGFQNETFSVFGIETFHDSHGGRDRGENTVTVLKADGLTLMHMGDIGHMPEADFYEKAGKVDILLIPVGGNYTIDAEQAIEICKIMEPNIIIPMHYKTLFLEMDVDPVYKFTDKAKGYFDRAHCSSSYEIEAANLKKRTRILVMDVSAEA